MISRLRPHLAPAAALAGLGLLFVYFYATSRGPSRAVPAAATAEAVMIEAYFTSPEESEATALRGGPDAAVARSIDQARETVDMAMYELNLWSIRDALLRAQARGVDVRMVMEKDSMFAREVRALVEAGIPIAADTDEGLMHDKFVVVDGGEVWTGSMNLTVTDAYYNNNNLIRFRSDAIGRAYTGEFEEMFVDGWFGMLSTPGGGAQTQDGRIAAYFSPDDGAALRLDELLDQARSSIEVMAFAFTSESIAEAILERAAAGVRVRIVMDEDQAANLGSQYGRFLEAGLDVRLDGNPNKMHHKVIIIDGAIVVT
ncbi:MAG TPA: phospholipase D-like domain-containing protein, partial [Anaerolineales bacterium]|nr:phospholipase D-like domain-containing protein [Anaerolineales bacterium]